MPEQTLILPGHDEMKKLLESVDNDSHTIQKFHPILLRYAGQEKVPEGVVMMITLAIHDYSQGLPSVVGRLMIKSIPDYLEVLISDSKLRKAATDHFNACS